MEVLSRAMRFKTLLAGGAALAWMLLAQSALGATVTWVNANWTIGQPLIIYQAAAGEINKVSIVEAPDGVFTITDTNVVITPKTTHCTSISPTSVRCEGSLGIGEEVHVRTKDGADSVDIASDAYYFYVHGGPGPDTLTTNGEGHVLSGDDGNDRLVGGLGLQELDGGRGADSIEGGEGIDFLRGWSGRDLLSGGPGPDELDGGGGPDVIAGGPGLDYASYESRRAPVRITLDGRANDGAAGENDWIQADVESAIGSLGPTTFIGNTGPNSFVGRSGYNRVVAQGGAGDDRLSGSNGPDVLSGGTGEDELNAKAGNDVNRGGAGDDTIDGWAGEDDLHGGGGNDRLSGGPGNDMLRGGPDRDRLSGNGGADVFYARDRKRDRVGGGPGPDRAHVDLIDALFSVEDLF